MIKKSILLSLILLLSISITTFAVTGMDFLENSSLLETNNYDCKALSIIIKALTANGQNTDIYRSKLLAAVSKQGVEAHAYALLATFNPDMATELTAKQQNDGSWNNDIYLTSLSTYALLATDQQFTKALSGIDYIIGVKVIDNNLFRDSYGYKDDDGIIVYIDANYNCSTTYDLFDRCYIKLYNEKDLFEVTEDITGVIHAWSQNSDGYTVELAIPWHLLYITPKSGLTIGYDLENRDDDDGGAIDGYRFWNGNVNNWNNTLSFGQCTLQ